MSSSRSWHQQSCILPQQRYTSSQAITPLSGCCHRQLYWPYFATASGLLVLPYFALRRSA